MSDLTKLTLKAALDGLVADGVPIALEKLGLTDLKQVRSACIK